MTVTVDSLDRSRELVLPELSSAVERLDPHTRRVVSYHLGWCDADGRPVSARPGKSVRPTLALLAADAVCGSPAAAVPGAVAAELVHNFSLVHDDLMDRDAERRHRPTVWAVWGDATAVLAGDAMLSLAHEVLSTSGERHAQQAAATLAAATRELIRGQAQDLDFERRHDVGLAECQQMAAAKTGALLRASAALGAVLGGATPAQLAALEEFGAELGMAFQLVDDVLGIWGSPEVTGKPVYSDLRARKKTLPVTWAVEHGGAAGSALADWLAREDAPTEEDVLRAADLVERAGGHDWATAEATGRVERAERALTAAGIADPPRRQLSDLARFVVERTA